MTTKQKIKNIFHIILLKIKPLHQLYLIKKYGPLIICSIEEGYNAVNYKVLLNKYQELLNKYNELINKSKNK